MVKTNIQHTRRKRKTFFWWGGGKYNLPEYFSLARIWPLAKLAGKFHV